MSGIEIVGLVLGALPLLVSGIAKLSATLSTVDRLIRPQRELNSLRMRINTELQLFRNTTQQLLLKITNDTDVKNLLEYPSSARWKEEEFERKLKDMLAESYSVWQQAMKDVLGAVEDIRNRLNLPEDKVCSANLAHIRHVSDCQFRRGFPRPTKIGWIFF
jgi:FtsZ-binding cell division protein ZapB